MNKKQKSARVQDLLGMLHALYPPALSESWDNVGLQVGDPASVINKVLISLDPSERALRAALDVGAQAVLSHHPLIFSPLKNISPFNETGRIVFEAIRNEVSFVCAHTNLDRGAGGLNDWLADALGILDPIPLNRSGGELVKLVVFIPSGYESVVAEALFRAGAGHVGKYDHSSFSVNGSGTFRPGAGSRPFRGEEGRDEKTDEIRFETILPSERVSSAVEKMLKVHPYEEVAYDLIPLLNHRSGVGLGRIGHLKEPLSLEAFAAQVKENLAVSSLRIVGNPGVAIRKVALCGGSGASLLGEAARRGADLFITGDVKYHEARKAEELGIAIVDAGHFATENLMVRYLSKILETEALKRGLSVEFVEMMGEDDPFRVI